MNTRAQEAQWALQALERGAPATAEEDVDETTWAEIWTAESTYPLTKAALTSSLTREGMRLVKEGLHHVEVVANVILGAPDDNPEVQATGPDSEHYWVQHIIPHHGVWSGGEIFGSRALGTAATAPEQAGTVLMGEVQHVELSGVTVKARTLVHSYALLQDTLADLNALGKVAAEDELPEPDPESIANARSLLPKLYEILPVRYRVTPTERRGVAIDAPMRHGASVAVECAPDNTVYCFATVDGNSRRAKFYQMDGLPDVFIEKALRDLAAG